MATLIKSKPTSPGRRFVIRVSRDHLHKGKPYEPLLAPLHKQGGRNNQGRITVRHQGGGHKRHYRLVDFKRMQEGIAGRVERIEYDPNRTAHIALVLYANGQRSYVIAPEGLKVGDEMVSGTNAPIKSGNCLPLSEIPVDTQIHAVELYPGKGAQLARSAGSSVTLVTLTDKHATLRLPSGEVRKVSIRCKASIGVASNIKHNLRSFGNAGSKRHLGIRPTVRGVAMNPVDHPHGGGEGKSSGGRHPVSPWGLPTKGRKTRSVKRTNWAIIKHCSVSKRKRR